MSTQTDMTPARAAMERLGVSPTDIVNGVTVSMMSATEDTPKVVASAWRTASWAASSKAAMRRCASSGDTSERECVRTMCAGRCRASARAVDAAGGVASGVAAAQRVARERRVVQARPGVAAGALLLRLPQDLLRGLFFHRCRLLLLLLLLLLRSESRRSCCCWR